MRLVLIAIIATVSVCSALEFKKTGPILPPVDGQVWNGTAWVTK